MKFSAQRFSTFSHVIVAARSNYEGEIHDLPACVPEAHRLIDALTNDLGCAIPRKNIYSHIGNDCTKNNFINSLTWCSENLTFDDTLIIYFSGHGISSEDGFILLTDKNHEEGLSSNILNTLLKNCKARGILMILDCCGGAGFAENAPDFFLNIDNCDYRLLLSATRKDQSSWELVNPARSLFTERLLSVIEGKVDFNEDGAIFFMKLLEFLQTSVREDSINEIGTIQEPIFNGILAQDPLIFLHRNQTLDAVRVSYQKITRKQLHKRVLATATTIIVSTLLIIFSYWSWLDQHRYIHLKNDQIILFHGYPNFTGFGLPKHLWEFDIDRRYLDSSSKLATGSPVILSRNENVNQILHDQLNDAGKFAIRLWNLDTKLIEDSSIAISYISNLAQDGRELGKLVQQVNMLDILSKLSDSDDVTLAYKSILALSQANPELAASKLNKRLSRDEIGNQLNILASWKSSCSSSVQEWLNNYASHDANYLFYPTVVDASIRSKCTLKIEHVLAAHNHQIKDAVFGFRITNPEEAKSLALDVTDALITAINRAKNNLPLEPATSRLITFARYLDSDICPLPLFNSYKNDAIVSYHLLAMSLKFCNQTSLFNLTDKFIQLKTSSELISIPTPYDLSLISLVDILEETNHSDRAEFYRNVILNTDNLDLKRQLVIQLRKIGEPYDYSIDANYWDRPDLQSQLLRWAASSSPEYAFSKITTHFRPGMHDEYLEITRFFGEKFSEQLLSKSKQLEINEQVIIITLIGSTEEVAKIITDPTKKIRATAGLYLPARVDKWKYILSEAKNHISYPMATIFKLNLRLEELEQIKYDLSSIPNWACSWRLKLLQRQRPLDHGLYLASENLGETICSKKTLMN